MTTRFNPPNRRQLLCAAGSVLVVPPAIAADSVKVEATTLHGRPAFSLSNGILSLSVLPGGGFIGDVHLISPSAAVNINPMRVPEYQTMDPYAFNLESDGPKYGTGIQRQLMSGYMGHFTCFPQFGASREEFAATGYGQHGELVITKWERKLSPRPNELLMAAHLPLNQYDFQRKIVMLPGESVVYVTETAENLTGYDRPVQWVQHVTMGPPFAEVGKLWADGSVDTVITGRGDAAKVTRWPQGGIDALGRAVDPREFSGTGSTWLMQQTKPRNWLTAYHQGHRVLFGHIYDAQRNPWVLDWQSDRHDDAFPVPGKVVARGYCWGNSAAAGGLRRAVSDGKINGVPTFGWIGPKAQLTQNYTIFLARIPEGWKGTGDVMLEAGQIRIAERENGREIYLKAERAGAA